MSFSNILPQTSVTLPSGAPRLPGSGTVVFGANSADGTLPPEISANYGPNASAIVWYSGPNNVARLEYYYLVYNDLSGYMGSIAFGYLPQGLGTVIPITQFFGEFGSGINDVMSSGDMIGTSLDVTSTRDVPVAENGVNAATMYLEDRAVTHNGYEINHGSVTSVWHGNGTDSYLSDNSGDVDQVISFVTTGTTAGVAYTLTVRYIISYDRIVGMSWRAYPVAAHSTAGTMTFPNAIPPAIISPLGSQYGVYTANTGLGTALLDNSGTIRAYYTGANTSDIGGSYTYPILKPTF